MSVQLAEDEIDLRAYIDVLRRRKWTIASVTVLAVLVAGIFSWMMPPVYEASVWLVVAQPPLQIGGNQASQEQGPRITAVFVPSTGPENVVTLAQTPGVLQQVVENLPTGVRRGLTADALRGMVKARVERNSSLVNLTVRGGDPERVAVIANTWAESVANASHALFESSGRETYKFFQEQTAKAKEQLDAAEDSLRKFDSENRIGLLQKEVETVTSQLAAFQFLTEQVGEARGELLRAEQALRDFDSQNLIGLLQAEINTITAQIADYNAQLQKLRVEEERVRSRLAQIRAELKNQPKLIARTTALANQPILSQTVKDLTQKDYQAIAQLRLIDEQLNPVYFNLEQARADATVSLAALTAEQEQIRETVRGLTARLKILQRNLANAQYIRAQLSRSADIARELYGGLVRSSSAVELAALKAERGYAEAEIRRLKARLERLQADLAREQYRRIQLARAVDTSRELYGVLVRRMEEMRVASLAQTGSVRVVSPATKPQAPVAPRKMLNILLAGILGLMGGVFIAFFQEFLAPREPVPVPERHPSE